MQQVYFNGRNPLNEYFVVDDDDYDRVIEHSWWMQNPPHTTYAYTQIRKNGKPKTIMLHRFIMNITDESISVDHINGNGLDNRKENLRVCSFSENNRNSKSRKNSTSQYKGVCWHKNNKKWQADIYDNGKHVYLGQFDNEMDAAKAYDKAAIELFGRFAKLNFPEDYPDYTCA